MPDDELLNAPAAAKLLGISTSQFNRRVQKGLIQPVESVRLRDRLYSKSYLTEYMNNWKSVHQTVKEKNLKDDSGKR